MKNDIYICVIFTIILSSLILKSANGQNSAPTCPSVLVSLDVTENTASGTNVHNISCTDVDTGDNGTLTYTITSGNGGSEFQINTVNGEGVLDLMTSPDYETLYPSVTPGYTLVVTVSDGGTPSLTYDVTIDVNIIGVNEFQPSVFVSNPVSVQEDKSVGTVVESPFIMDFDAGVDGQYTASIVSQTPGSDVFIIDPTNGEITLRKALDYETVTTYTVTFMVTDKGTPAKNTSVDLIVQVTDINDTPPDCGTTTQYYVTAYEDWAVNDVIQALNCTDAESGTSLIYRIHSGDTTKFKVTTDGSVQLNAQIDVDTENTNWPLVIRIVDNGAPQLTSFVNIDVLVEGVDDLQPVWKAPESGTYSVSVDENSPVGTVVTTISATDADLINAIDSQITYSIETVTSLFGIGALTGEVVVTSDGLDRETNASYTLTIAAYSSNQTTNKITGTMTITINDLNDVAPIFSQDVYNVTLAEDSPTGAALGVALATGATDTDQGTNGQITYSILSGNTASGCGHTIDGTGDIYLGENLNYETSTLCPLVIAATDGGTPTLSSTATAFIVVTPVNEFTPVFGGPYNFNVAEDATTGTSIGTVAATDSDTGDDGAILYSLNTHADKFFVEPTTGLIKVLTALDRETTASYNVAVYAIDQSTTTQKTGSVTAVVSVTDINDNGPVCVDVEYVSLTSSVNVGDTVYTANCSDADSGLNGALTYSIVSGNTNSDFTLSAAGVLTVQNPLSQVNYNIKLLVSDQGTGPNTANVYAVITVTANPIVTSFPLTLSVNETEIVGTVITTISATAASGILTYEIVSGNTENKFQINKYIGALYLISPLDRETTASYSLVIRITDSVSSLTVDNTTTITVEDMNDNTPTFSSSFYERSVVESVTPTLVIVNLPVTDADINQNAAITYNIESGNAEGKFSISASGDLSLIATVDTETTPLYTLIITATDNGSPTQLTGSTIVLIKVTNVNEYTPQFLPASGIYSHNLAENTSVGAIVFNISAQDLDVGTQITYAITVGNTGNAFTIDSQTGSIYLSKYLDRETLDTYTLSLEADNGVGQTASGTLTITVDDINDNDPTFSPTSYTSSIIETSSVGISVVTVTCNDIDLGVNAVFVLSIIGGNTAGAFRLDGSRVEVNNTLDYETLNKYILIIEAVDTGVPPRSSTTTVIIDITPFYTQPTFPALTPTQAISESTVLGTTIYDLDATLSGSTEGISGDLSYTLQSGDPTGKFSVNTYTGEVTVIGSLDRETTASYNLYFVAENRNDASKRDSITLTVTLNDVNDNSPAFTSSSYIFVIDEGVALATPVGTVNAADTDSASNGAVSYSIVAGESNTDFSINPTSGQITVNAALSATVRDSYLISVQASDGGAPSKSTTIDVIITVNDLNDNTPTFGQTTFNVQITESAPVGQVLYQFTVTDADKGSNALITYTITSGNIGSKFTFEALTGELKLNNVVDRETLASYSLTIEARDAGVPSLTGTATVSLTVQDVNDNAPQFLNSIYSVTVPRISATGTSLTQVFATDIDAGTNADVQYYISSGNTDNLFFVNDTTGIVTTVAELTSASDTYNIICQAVDNGYPRLTSTVTVAIAIDPMLGSVTPAYSFTVSESIPVNTPIGTVFQDPVHPAGATIHYTIIGGNFGNNIQISLIGGSISNANTLDRETHSDYYLTVQLQDINNPITYTKLVHIAITDVNDVTPSFASGSGAGPYTINIVENSPVGLSVHTISAVDTDEGTNGQITYEIPTSNAAATSMFNINSAGLITLKTSPDYELVTRVVFEVLAKDGGSPSYTGTVTITASIVDVPDTQIPGTSAFFSFECSSDAVNDDVIATLTPSGFGLTTASTDSIQYITMNSAGVFNVKSSGDFYVQKEEFVYPEARYYMWVVIRVTDAFNNVTATSGMVRVDTFIPSNHMVILGHNVSATSIENQKGSMMFELNKLFCSTCRVGIWKIRGYSGTARRRLLATESESLVYVVSDTSTDVMGGIESEKTFLTQSEILQVLQNTDGTPAASLNTANYATFPVTSVSGYTATSSSSGNWVQSTEGIAVLCTIGASIVLLATILVVYFLCTRERKYRFPADKERLTPDKVAFADSRSEKSNSTTPPKKEKLQSMVNPYTHPDGDTAIKKAKQIKKQETFRALPKVPSKQNVRVSMIGKIDGDDEFDHTQNHKCKISSAEIIRVKSCQVRPDDIEDQAGENMNHNSDLSTNPSCDKRQNLLSARERWDILLEKAGFGLQSLQRIAKLSRLKTAPFDKDWIFKKKQYSNLNGFVSNKSNVSDTGNRRVAFISPVKHNSLTCSSNTTSERLSAEKACLAKDPFYVGWAKIIGRRLKQDMIARRKQRIHSEIGLEMTRTATNDSGIASEVSFVDEYSLD